ncbi:MAG TPA: hypothetical protein PKM73_16670 [Verrucomicrobiota bacterium]|nr:hypothetical protein [Verrucomicrobiota bacterium]HNU52273.1 hypothetical protein [Verrucomicrobiota bacterium]
MKWLSLRVAGACFAAAGVLAQVTVQVEFEQDQYLADERLRCAVRIVNFSGRSLLLGDYPEWLDITVEGDRHFVVGRTGDPPVVEPFVLPTSGRATRWVDLVPYFNIGQPGRYQVTATVRIAELGMEITSKPAAVNITAGALVWKQEFGIPDRTAEGGAGPEVRRYALVQSLTRKNMTLYVRVTDAYDTKVFRVVEAGPMLTFSRPEAQIDRRVRLHLLWQTSAKQFTYVVVNPDGEMETRQTYQQMDARPALRVDDAGSIRVHGGYRRVGPYDIPKPDPAALEPAFAPVAGTNAPVAVPAPASENTTKPKAKKKS